MTDSLRDDQIGAEENRPYAKIGQLPAYDPEESAYKVDEANDPYRRFSESVSAGATIKLSLACKDGRREFIELDKVESIAWVRDTFEDRIRFANEKICERRANVALTSARRLQENLRARLTPDEEACLREFGLLEDALIPKAEGGYDRTHRLVESRLANVKLREDGFWDGSFGDAYGSSYTAPSQREYLPRGGPQGQQQHISDVWDALAKSYWAFTHDPLIRFACELVADFVLGRGVAVICEDEGVQEVVDEYMDREDTTRRLYTATVSLSRDGDLFCRKFRFGNGRMKHRVVPAETIWEVVTDAEDVEDVFWYVQRYPTRYQLFVPPGTDAAKMKWIERTIPAADMIHAKLHVKESDARGRSDPYAALGWGKRLRDYFDAIIQKEYAGAAYQWDYTVEGGQANIDAIASSVIPSDRPLPGSYFLHNKMVDVKSVASQVRAVAGQGTAYDALINHIALAFGLSKSYFGSDSHTNRASALVGTEPTAKHLETRQDVIDAFLSEMIEDVIQEALAYGLIAKGKKLGFKCVFPQIIKADSGSRVTMLRQAESSFYISRQTAAEQVAGEIEVEDYDFDTEMAKIKKEIDGDPLLLTAKDQESVKRGLPSAKDPAFPPGFVPNPDYAPGNGQPAVLPAPHAAPHQADGKTPALPPPDAGDASPTSATGAAKIRNEQGRGGADDRSTVEVDQISDDLFAEAARKRGVIVIRP